MQSFSISRRYKDAMLKRTQNEPAIRPDATQVLRRAFVGGAVVASTLSLEAQTQRETGNQTSPAGDRLAEEIKKEKIRRVMFAGPKSVTSEATVAEMDSRGNLTVLRPGSNGWVCVPGDQNVIGRTDMCIDAMGMIWWKDLLARKPKPTNSSPGLIYMLNGAIQRSYTDPFDTTSPAIPIGPHWMILWPFEAKSSGIGAVMRDGGAMIMFAGTPYAHLHVCGSPWDGQEYRAGDRGVWTMTYSRP
jgi:hypothetical protein